MDLALEFLIILILLIFQSLFGIGLLLFGTPSFLLLGYSFESTLVLLLPISISISFFQILYQKFSIRNIAMEFSIFCLPFLVFFLIIAIKFGEIINIKIYVSLLLIVSSLIILNKNRIINNNLSLKKYRKVLLMIIGSIHGFTNMGGSFLSIFSTMFYGGDRGITRNYISYGYLVMGVIQYITVLFVGLERIDLTKLFYVFIALVLFLPIQKIFNKIDDSLFTIIINYTALIFGFLTLLMSLKLIS
tara:strand:+ start:288 stop:1025 length:738 start_codon:yes stop_codon:yes gene_type:complete